jgi:hypothetical protein
LSRHKKGGRLSGAAAGEMVFNKYRKETRLQAESMLNIKNQAGLWKGKKQCKKIMNIGKLGQKFF